MNDMSEILLDTEEAEPTASGDGAAGHALKVVRIADADISFEVEPGETILRAALRANVHLAHDCKSGTCGTCRFRLIEGAVSYDEQPMALFPEDEEEGYGLACQAHPTCDIVAEVELLPPLMAEPQRHAATVRSIEPLAHDVTRLVLELPAEAATSYRPGQYGKIILDDGSVRSFSMASAPNGETVDFHIRRIGGGRFTSGRLAQLTSGDRLEVEMPHGAFFYREGDFRPMLMLATGTGIAPIKSLLESLFDDPDCPPITLYWGARAEADLYMDAELRSWGDHFEDFTYVPVLSRADAEWTGRRGHVQQVASEDFEDFSEHAIYLCGSPRMVDDARRLFLHRGASANHIYADSFLFQHNLVRQ